MFLSDKFYDGMKACSCDRRYKPLIDNEENGYYVFCRICNKAGASRKTKQQAIEAWNRGDKV